MMAKITNRIPERLSTQLAQLGYRRLTGEEQCLFDPYYDKMNDSWSASTDFLSMLAWHDAIPVFYKPIGDLLCCLQYDGPWKQWMAIPFIGRYSQESVEKALRVLVGDMEALRFPLEAMDISEWMLPFYQGVSGISWEIDRPRDLMEYVYRKEDLTASLDRSNKRYLRNHFIRKFSPEMVVLTPTSQSECVECIKEFWCSEKDCADCLACPVDAVANVLNAWGKLRAGGVLVRVEGRPVGFCIVTCRNGHGFYHFKHKDNHMQGLDEHLIWECLTRFMDGAREINFAEDMGLDGLRAYKCRLAPYALSPRIILRGKRTT